MNDWMNEWTNLCLDHINFKSSDYGSKKMRATSQPHVHSLEQIKSGVLTIFVCFVTWRSSITITTLSRRRTRFRNKKRYSYNNEKFYKIIQIKTAICVVCSVPVQYEFCFYIHEHIDMKQRRNIYMTQFSHSHLSVFLLSHANICVSSTFF